MAWLRGLLTATLCVCMLVLGIGRPAGAGEPLSDKWGEYPADYVDVNPLLVSMGLPTQPVWSESEDGLDSFGPLDESCPTDYPPNQAPTERDIAYKGFRRTPGGVSIAIYLDQWDPIRSPGTSAPAVVLIHGGGWRQGCRRVLHKEAVEFANQGYIVFSIDYRLSCQIADSPTSDEAPLCGWQYPTIDIETGTPGAAIHDVQDAVAWVKNNASTYWSGFNQNQKVAAAGSSAGGNLLYRGAGVLSVNDDRRPQVVAGWSGNTYFAEMSDGTLYCDGAPTQGTKDACWAAVIKYIGCDIKQDPSPCRDNYEQASPMVKYTSTGPPAFIANSTGELVNILNARDFDFLLGGLFIDSDLCQVNGSVHGRGYLFSTNKECQEHTGITVIKANENYFATKVFP